MIYFNEIQNKDGFYITKTVNRSTFVDSYDGSKPDLGDQFNAFFIAHYPFEIVRVKEVHSKSGSGTLNISNNGDSLLDTSYSLSASADVVRTKEGADLQNTVVSPDSVLKLTYVGGLDPEQSINVTLYCVPFKKGNYQV